MTDRHPDLEQLLTEFQPTGLTDGLFIPTERPMIAGSTVPAIIPRESVRASGLVVRGFPAQTQPIDFFYSYVTAADYLRPIPPEMIVPLIRHMATSAPFKDVATMLAAICHLTEEDPAEAAVEDAYLTNLQSTARVRLKAALTSDHPRRRLLARQTILRALRYAIELTEMEPRSDGFEWPQAILMSHLSGDSMAPREDQASEDLYGIFPAELTLETVRNELFNRGEDPLVLIARARLLWGTPPNPDTHPLRGSPSDLLVEATGLSPDDWLAFGFGVLAHRINHPPGGPMWMPASFFSHAEAGKRAAFLSHVAADRQQLADQFRDQDLNWGFVPFESHPLLTDGTDYLLLDKQLLVDRITTGLYWFVVDCERSIGDGPREAWQRAFGNMFEQYVVAIARRIAPTLMGGGTTFYGEEALKDVAASKSCDCAVDFGRSLVLLEVVGGRLTLRSRVEGDAAALARETHQLVYKKAEQLDALIRTLLEDEAPLTGIQAPHGRRYHPVVVNLGSYPVNPMTMVVIEERVEREGWFTDARVAPLTVIDVGEFEMVEALGERGHGTFPELLDAWIASDLHRVSFRNHLYDTITSIGTDTFRSEALLDAWRDLDEALVSVLLPDVRAETDDDEN